jgi:integrase
LLRRPRVIGTYTPRVSVGPSRRRKDRSTVRPWFAWLVSAANGRGNGSGGGLSAKTVRYIHGILRKALADAQPKGTVARNVADLADPPKVSARSKREMRVWCSEELRRFLELVEDHQLYVAFVLAANTGMRRGEVLGLRWKDVDLDRARLSVNQAAVSVAYEVEVGDVKTDTARRTIDLDARTVAVLRKHRKDQLEKRLAAGLSRDDAGFVVARPDGSPVHPDYFSQSFERTVAASSLPRIRLHDLRHTHASILLRAGQP